MLMVILFDGVNISLVGYRLMIPKSIVTHQTRRAFARVENPYGQKSQTH
jgi:hypothetical protein